MTRTNYYLIVLMLVLGITPLLDSGYQHWIIFLASLLVGAAVLKALTSQVPVGWDKLTGGLFAAYIMAGLASLISSYNPHETLVEVVKLCLYLGVFFLTATLNKDERQRLLRLMVLVIFLVALMGLLLFLLIDASRIEATFVNANPLGIYLVMGFFLAAVQYLSNGKKAILTAAAVIGSGVILTGSRGSMLAGLVPFVLLVFRTARQTKVQNNYKDIKRLVQVVLTVIILVGLLSSIAPALQGHYGQLLDSQAGQELLKRNVLRTGNFVSGSVGGRWSFWKVAVKEFQDHPILGVGAGNYHNAYFQYWNQDRFYSRFAHNHYLQVLAETGALGFGLFLLLLAALTRQVWANRNRNDSLYQACVLAGMAFLLHIGIDFSWDMPAVTLTFWALAGMAGSRVEHGEAFRLRLKPVLAGLMLLMLVLTSLQAGSWLIARQGADLEDNKNYQDAIDKYRLAVKIYPLRYDYWSHISYSADRLYRQTSDESYYKQAVAALDRALALSPGNYYLWTVKGTYLANQGTMDQAEIAYEKAVQNGGFYPAPYGDLGFFLLKQGNLAEAEAVFSQGIKWYPAAVRTAPPAGRVRLMADALKLHQGLAQVYQSGGKNLLAEQQKEKVKEITGSIKEK